MTLFEVHYKDWNKSWDEYVTDARLLKVNEEILKKQKELQDEIKKNNPTLVNKAVKKTESDSANSSRDGSKDREKDFNKTKNVAVRIEKLKKDTESDDYVNKEEKPVISSRTITIKLVVAFKATEVSKSMKNKSKKDLEKESVTAKSQQNSRSQSPFPAMWRQEYSKEIVIQLLKSLKTVLVDDFDYIDRQRQLFNILFLQK